jgi:hypothetical protein
MIGRFKVASRRHIALGVVQIRFVGDVTHHARLSARSEQGALRALEYLDTFEIRGIDIQISARQLRGLLI